MRGVLRVRAISFDIRRLGQPVVQLDSVGSLAEGARLFVCAWNPSPPSSSSLPVPSSTAPPSSLSSSLSSSSAAITSSSSSSLRRLKLEAGSANDTANEAVEEERSFAVLLDSCVLRLRLELLDTRVFDHSFNLTDIHFVSLCGEVAPKAGRFTVALTCPAEQAVATVTLESCFTAFLTHPLARVPSENSFKLSTGNTILVGHRGIGMNKVLFAPGSNLPRISENTCDSFLAAFNEGVQYVEFDAQVTKDLQVVLYHDSIVSEYEAHTEIKDLTVSEFLATKPKYGDKPFTTLENALKTLPQSLGFNIEIKYPLPEEIPVNNLATIEYNTFVDAVLNTTLTHAGDRAIVFSCFNPVACQMAKEKQSRYPVLFLTMGGTHPTWDSRTNSFLAAAEFAKTAGLDGIVSDATPIMQDPVAQIKAAKKVMGETPGKAVVFTYGSLNCVKGNAKRLRDAGLDGIIVDTVVQVRDELKEMN